MIEPWPPTRHSPPLSADFPSLFGRYENVIQIAFQHALGHRLDDWQVSLLKALTEVFPDGHQRAGQLRWRQGLVMVARQQGKTELAAALGLLFMLARPRSLVIGIASTADQARLVYKRAMNVITGNAALVGRFDALTDTRGLRAKSGSEWQIKAAKSAALQGLPVDLAVVDEVHLVKPELWSDLLAGTGARPDTLVVGITTAGDDDSVLLKRLLEDVDKGTDRLGFWVWESPVADVSDDDATLLEHLRAANPALASGRLDADTMLADVRATPPQDVIRYRLNRFVASMSAFIEVSAWQACTRDQDEGLPAGRPVFTIDRTPDWSHASITATVQDEQGVIHTEVVASIVKPSIDRLEAVCVALADHRPEWFVVDRYQLGELGKRLKDRGLPVLIMNQADVISASSRFYALVTQRRLRHAGDQLLTLQIPRTTRKNVGSSFRIARSGNGSQIDAVMATAMGAYVAETVKPAEDQLFV